MTFWGCNEIPYEAVSHVVVVADSSFEVRPGFLGILLTRGDH